MRIRITLGWFGFWILVAVFIVCDHWIYSRGHDSFLQEHKTNEEKELQRLKIEELRLKNSRIKD